MIFSWSQYTPITYGTYQYPNWGLMVGWLLAGLSLICIPLGMIKAVYETPGNTLWQVIFGCGSCQGIF